MNRPLKIVGRVDTLPSGRFRFRTEIGGRTTSETFDTPEEARQHQVAVSRELAAQRPTAKRRETLNDHGRAWFRDRRAEGDVRDIDGEEGRWANHIAETKLGQSPLLELSPSAVKAWFRERCATRIQYPYKHPRNGQRVDKKTILKALVILRLCLDEAVEDGKIKSNPARAFRVKRKKDPRTHEPWTYLDLGEQDRLFDREPSELLDMVAYALYTACRQGEQWNQKLVDVRPDAVVVRYGSVGRATKGGKVRTVPLFGLAAVAVERQLKRLEGRANPHGLLWPSIRRGGRRGKGVLPSGFHALLAAAGIIAERRHDQRPVRWQDLRHSGASSLVAGWWGRAWSLQEVRDLLGHSTITMTERYAHLAPQAVALAAKGTPGRIFANPSGLVAISGIDPVTSTPPSNDRGALPPEPCAFNPSVQGSSPCRPTRQNKPKSHAVVAGCDGTEAVELARACVEAIAAGSVESRRLAVELAEAVLERLGVPLALDILDGGPLWASSALRLAALVIGDPLDAVDAARGAS